MKQLIKYLLFFIPILSFGQNAIDIKTFKKAVELSKTKEKPIFLIIESNSTSHANLNAKKTLRNPDFYKITRENFIVFEADLNNSSIKNIISKYNIKTLPTFLFLHNNGEVFLKETGYSPIPSKYIQMINLAIEKKGEKSLSVLEKEFSENQNDNFRLKKLIDARKSIGITDNAELVEKFVLNLSSEELTKYETILFILEAGPYADGNAFKIAFSNRNMINSIYSRSSGGNFTKIRTAITDNTIKNAIRTKNIEQAKAVGNYLEVLAGPIYGPKNYTSTLLNYYRGVGDTANFLKNAIPFYDNNYMTMSMKSVKEKQEQYLHSEILKSLPFSTPTLVKSGNDSIEVAAIGMKNKSISTSAIPVDNNNLYANILNQVAWDFYQTGTKDINYLSKAMIWSRRSIELYPSANYYNTLAHILYQLTYTNEAIKIQELAISQAKIQKISSEKMHEDLKKMKNKTL